MYEKVSIILPCRNEQEAIGFCLEEIEKTLKQYNLDSEIIVSDSSTDNSTEIASSKGVKVVKHNQEGYGLAIKEGIKNASGEIIIYADVDGTYDFKEIPKFIKIFRSKGIKCVVATDHMDVFREHIIPGMKLDELFDDFLISYEIGKLKSDIDIENKKILFFETFLKKNDLKYENVLLLDDCLHDASYKELGFEQIRIEGKDHLLDTLKILAGQYI